jgi:3-hydroxybutyryl-CoA dehydrogenase
MSRGAVGVVGAGVMGAGVAQVLAETGHAVTLVDVSPAQLEQCQREIRRSLRFRRLLGRSGAAPEGDDALERIAPTTDYERLGAVAFVIENVTEDVAVKREVYGRLDAICPPDTLFAANTSAISITRIGSWTRRPASVVGIHFMNPVPLKPMVEVIRGHHTSDATLARTQELLAAMGKQWVVVNDAPGFVSNRVLMLTINEAIFLLHEHVASADDVDRIFKGCFEHKMGPLETADLIGLDTILRSLEVLYESYCDGKYRPCPLLKKMVDAGLHGRKTGRGFYDYGSGAAASAGEASRHVG